MNFIVYIVFGLITGTVANFIDPRPSKGGIVGSIVLGIVGSILGGFLGDTFFGVGVTGFNFTSMVVAVVGALIALFIGRTFFK